MDYPEAVARPGPKREVSDIEIVACIRESDDAFVTAAELGETLGLSTNQMRERLGQLKKQDVVESKRAGSGKGWWLV